MNPICSISGSSINGTTEVPGDKSISHRALIIGSLAIGQTNITGLLESEDVLATVNILRQLGAKIEQSNTANKTSWQIFGCGIGGITEPLNTLDLGNSGTSARLLMGILASHGVTATLTGDESLCNRPMKRVIDPLQNIGAEIYARSGDKLPITILGTESALPGDEKLEIPSAQVKSAILLAGLNATGITTLIEPTPSRDHTEKMLKHFDVDLKTKKNINGSREITLVGQPEMKGRDILIPGDISSAAFPIVAAIITPGSELRVNNVGINPLRTGLIDSLKDMGANVRIINKRKSAGEPVGDIKVQYSKLRGIKVPATRVPSMIDEYPILCIAASVADGTSIFEGIEELKFKECDRIETMASGLKNCNIEVESTNDSLIIHGKGIPPLGGTTICSQFDHRIAMSFLILGQISQKPVFIDEINSINTSFPGFIKFMNKLGANMDNENPC